MSDKPERPNPGSDEARKRGCTCATIDNNRGKFPPYPPDGWWITGGCPVHDPKPQAPLGGIEQYQDEDR